MPVPVDVQVPILLKVLAFDRHTVEAREKPLVVGVLYQSGFRLSSSVRDEVMEALSRSGPGGPGNRTLKLVAIDAEKNDDLAEPLARREVNVLYVTPLRAFDLGRVVSATRRTGALSVTGVPEYVEAGLSIGIELRQDRPRILVNLEAARAEGADLTAPEPIRIRLPGRIARIAAAGVLTFAR